MPREEIRYHGRRTQGANETASDTGALPRTIVTGQL